MTQRPILTDHSGSFPAEKFAEAAQAVEAARATVKASEAVIDENVLVQAAMVVRQDFPGAVALVLVENADEVTPELVVGEVLDADRDNIYDEAALTEQAEAIFSSVQCWLSTWSEVLEKYSTNDGKEPRFGNWRWVVDIDSVLAGTEAVRAS